MKMRRLASGLAGICLVSVFVSVCLLTIGNDCAAQTSQTYNWKMVLARPSGAMPNIPFIEFANEVQKRSNGRIKITVVRGNIGFTG